MSASEVSTNADSDTSDETTRLIYRRWGYIGLSVTMAIVSGVMMGFAQSYDLAYTAPHDVTEEQGYLIDKCRSSWMLACAGTVFGPIAAIAEYICSDATYAESKEKVKEYLAYVPGPPAPSQDGNPPATYHPPPPRDPEDFRPKKISQLRLALALLVTLIIACLSVAYACLMWDKGVKPKVTSMRRFKKGRGEEWKPVTERKTCRNAEMSHCDKLEKLYYSLVAGSVTSWVFFALICTFAWHNFEVEKWLSSRNRSTRSRVTTRSPPRRAHPRRPVPEMTQVPTV